MLQRVDEADWSALIKNHQRRGEESWGVGGKMKADSQNVKMHNTQCSIYWRSFPHVRSVYFSSLVLVSSQGDENLKQWCRTTDRLQLSSALADRSFISQTLPKESPSSFLWILLGFPLLYSQSPPFGYAWAKQSVYPPLTNEREWKWAYTQDQLTIMLYNSRLCSLCLSICLPIIQSVVIRCRIFMSS